MTTGNKCKGFTADELLNTGRLLDEYEAAFIQNRSVSTLQRDRWLHRDKPDIPYVRQGRSVRYEPRVIRAIIQQGRVGTLLDISAVVS